MNTSFSPGAWPKEYNNAGEYQRDLSILMRVRNDEDIFIDDAGQLMAGFAAKMKYKISENVHSLKDRISLKKLEPKQLKIFLKIGKDKNLFKRPVDYHEAKSRFQHYINAHQQIESVAIATLQASQTPDEKAATIIQKTYHKWRVRSRIVLPSQILPKLKEKLIPQIIDMERLGKTSSFTEQKQVINEMVQSIALGLCRLIDFGLTGLREGEPTKLGSFNYTRPVFAGITYTGSEEVEFPFDCVVTLSDHGKKVSILFEAHEIGKGTDRVVRAAQELTISLSLDPSKVSRDVKITEVVLSRVASKERFSPVAGVEELGIHQEALKIAEKSGASHHVAEVPTPLTGTYAFEDDVRKQKWYNSDFQKAYEKGYVPLGLSEDSPVHRITSTDKLHIMTGVCKALASLHKEGYVHLDLHQGNVNVEILPDDNVIGVLADFGHALRKPKITSPVGNDRWDNAARKGFPTTFTDCYAAAMVFAESTVNNFYKILQQPYLLDSKEKLDDKKAETFMNMVVNRLVDYDKDLFDELKSCRDQQMITTNVKRLLTNPKKWSFWQKAILANLKDHIGGLFYFANQVRESGKTLTKESFLQLIDERLKNRVNEKERAILLEMKKDAITVDAALDLAYRAFEDSKKVSALILNDAAFKERLYSDDQDTRQKAVLELQKQTSHLTAEEIIQKQAALEVELKSQLS